MDQTPPHRALLVLELRGITWPGKLSSASLWHAGFDGEVELNWQAAEMAFKQTWGELDAAEMLPAEALQKVS